MWVAKLFKIGKTYEIEEELELVKEEDGVNKWKVCGTPFSLPTEV